MLLTLTRFIFVRGVWRIGGAPSRTLGNSGSDLAVACFDCHKAPLCRGSVLCVEFSYPVLQPRLPDLVCSMSRTFRHKYNLSFHSLCYQPLYIEIGDLHWSHK